MIPSIYLFFSGACFIMFFLAVYDWGATKNRVAALPALLSMVLSFMLSSASWNIYQIIPVYESTLLGGSITDYAVLALSSFEATALGFWWLMIGLISFILILVVYFEKPAQDLHLK
jgi:hypothetical protein